MSSESPPCLQELCLSAVCASVDAILVPDGGFLERRRFGLFVHAGLSERLLAALGRRGLLTDGVLSAFEGRSARLKAARLSHGHALTAKGLQVLHDHDLLELECAGLQVAVDELIDCLNSWTLEHLRRLDVSMCSFLNVSRFLCVHSLSRLKGLRSLNVSHTEINQHGLEVICEDLGELESLDLSCTLVQDLAPLLRLKESLTSLIIFNATRLAVKNFISTITRLEKLKYLDISQEKDEIEYPRANELISNVNSLPNLVFLDISGKTSLDADLLLKFIDAHKKLRYLGLVLGEAAYHDVFTDETHPNHRKELTVAGTATVQQISVALERYTHRAVYVQKCLYFLFRMTPTFRDARPDIIKLVLPGMKNHTTQFDVQMAATACLYNLTKGDFSLKLHPSLLKEVVHLTLSAMETFPKHNQLHRNSLLTLCSDPILQGVNFDRFRCVKLVMDSLCAVEDSRMNRMGVAICSILAAKISTAETSLLGSNPNYMRKLLSMVKSKVSQHLVDITMKFTLSALWNLTDESSDTCRVFLQEGGIELFLEVLETFEDDSTVETKVLGLMNNIAEVQELRSKLMIEEFIVQLMSLLHSDQIEVSYFAAGIISHLASDGDASWTVANISRSDILAELWAVVGSWKMPEGEMVTYRSFDPFFPLLKCAEDGAIQLWAVWAIHHVCTKNPKRYCRMFVSEGGAPLLSDISTRSETHESIKHFCDLIMKTLSWENAV